MQVEKIISGGQTGADRAALDAAMELSIAHGGSLPRGRKTEAGPLPARYRLRELESGDYGRRTRKNVRDADGTLIISHGPLTGGSALTAKAAAEYRRPWLHVDLDRTAPDRAAGEVAAWLRQCDIAVLNVAGPRASGDPLIYGAVRDLLRRVFTGQMSPLTGFAIRRHNLFPGLAAGAHGEDSCNDG